MDAVCPEDYSMAVWSQPVTAIMGSVMNGKREVTRCFAIWRERLFYFQFSLKFSPLQWQSLSSGAHLTLMRTVCLLSRGASWWQPDWSDAATALSGEVELCVVLVVNSDRGGNNGVQVAGVPGLSGEKTVWYLPTCTVCLLHAGLCTFIVSSNSLSSYVR